MNAPTISVVLGVHNGAGRLSVSMDSVLCQTGVDFEVIVVDDGSTDGTPELLRRYAQNDSRIRLLRQQNAGLTAALSAGCQLARAPVIARQDVGDVSLPDRLEVQLQYLRTHSEVVAVGCGVRRVCEQGDLLGETPGRRSPSDVTRDLSEHGTGILHPASMFRKDAFERVGGYRTQFRFAQDTDLWLRLSEVGLIGECPETLFELTVDDHGISATRTDQQKKLWQLARACHRARKCGESEKPFLTVAQRISDEAPQSLSARQKNVQRRRAQYFIGSQLLEQGNSACRMYFMNSVLEPRLAIPSAVKLARSFVGKNRK